MGQEGGTRWRHRVRAVALLLPLVWLLLGTSSAWAHATLLATTPAAGYAVATAPEQVTLDFDESVGVGATPLRLTDADGTEIRLGQPTLSLNDRRLSAAVAASLARGSYRVQWEVSADDGDLVGGTFGFTVGEGTVPAEADTAGTMDSPAVVALRWLVFLGLALGLGGTAGRFLALRVRREAAAKDVGLAETPRYVLLGAATGGLGAIGLAVALVGPDPGRLLDSTAGRLLAVEIAGFAVAAGSALAARRYPRSPLATIAAATPLLAVVAAEGLRAHPQQVAAAFGAALTMAHLLGASLWVGALAYVLHTAYRWRTTAGWVRPLVYDYARLAVVAVLVVLASGTVEAVLLLPSFRTFLDTTYGRVLLVKLGLVAAVLVFAVLARRRLLRLRAAPTVVKAARGEIVALAGILAVTAVLVSVAPPTPVSNELAAPPPPIGLVVPAGTLAGQVTVTAAASTGQLVVRLATPADDHDLSDNATVRGGPTTATSYRLTGDLSTETERPRALTFRGCGQGCFTTAVNWSPGTSQVRLSIAAPPWHGGTAELTVPWPPRAEPALLPSVVAAMRAVPRLIVHESVTSDYTGDPGTTVPLPMSGAQFIESDPYAVAAAGAVVLRTIGTATEIGISYPEGIVIRLYVGPDHRILREEFTNHNHLIIRTFEYP